MRTKFRYEALWLTGSGSDSSLDPPDQPQRLHVLQACGAQKGPGELTTQVPSTDPSIFAIRRGICLSNFVDARWIFKGQIKSQNTALDSVVTISCRHNARRLETRPVGVHRLGVPILPHSQPKLQYGRSATPLSIATGL
jgi:hypothetical protein